MSSRSLAILASLATVFVIGGMVLAIAAVRPGGRASSTGNPLSLRNDFADKLDLFDSAGAFNAGSLTRAVLINSTDGAYLSLADTREKAFPRQGVWVSPIVKTAFDFEELMPSYNAFTPSNTGVRLQARVRDTHTGAWSPWLYFGRWGRTVIDGKDDQVVTTFDGGTVKTDVLLLTNPADAYQVRFSLQSLTADAAAAPIVRRIAVSYSGPVADSAQRARFLAPITTPVRGAKVLAVPFIAQGDAPTSIIGDVCSPTSLTMVAAYGGAARPLSENALAIYDDEAGIFGNWNRAVQRAGELGLDAWLTRFRNWDQVRAMIAINQPVVASIRFEKGAMPNNPIYQENDGHLIVIRGFNADGDVVVNDPASRAKGNSVVYKASELAAAWFGAGGVGYIVRPRGAPRIPGGTTTTLPSN